MRTQTIGSRARTHTARAHTLRARTQKRSSHPKHLAHTSLRIPSECTGLLLCKLGLLLCKLAFSAQGPVESRCVCTVRLRVWRRLAIPLPILGHIRPRAALHGRGIPVLAIFWFHPANPFRFGHVKNDTTPWRGAERVVPPEK